MRRGGGEGGNAYTQTAGLSYWDPSILQCVYVLATQHARTSHGETGRGHKGGENEVDGPALPRWQATDAFTLLSWDAQWGGLHLRSRGIGATYRDGPDAGGRLVPTLNSDGRGCLGIPGSRQSTVQIGVTFREKQEGASNPRTLESEAGES